MNVQEKIGLSLLQNFSYTLYDMVMEFLGNRSVFEPPHMIDLMDGGNNLFKQAGNL
jgi:hypothetical protein